MYDVALLEAHVAKLHNQSYEYLLDEDVRLMWKIYAVVCFVYMPIILIVNAYVMWGIILYRGFWSNKNFWIFSFCIADYIMGGLCVPMQAFSHMTSTCGLVLSGKLLCLSRIASAVLVGVGSLYTLLFFTLDRFVEIAWPARYRKLVTTRRTMFAIYLVWCHALIWALLPLAGWNRFDRTLWPLVMRCNFHVALPDNYIHITYLHFAVCVGVSIIAFVSMIVSIRWQIAVFRKNVSYFTFDQLNFFLDRVDFVKIIFWIFICYIITWIPFLLVVPLGYFRPISNKTDEVMQIVLQLLNFTNSLVHVPIYIHFRKEYKAVVKTLLRTPPNRWIKQLAKLNDEMMLCRYSLDASTLEGQIFPKKDCLADAIKDTMDDFRTEMKSYVYVGEESGMPTVKTNPPLTSLQVQAKALDDSWIGTIVGRFTSQSTTILPNLPKKEMKSIEPESTQQLPPPAVTTVTEVKKPVELYVRTSLGTWV